MDKIHANITLSRQGKATLFRIGIPADLLEESKEALVTELLFRNYALANEHVNKFIKDTELPILVIDQVKNLTRKVRMITPPDYTPVDEVDNLNCGLDLIKWSPCRSQRKRLEPRRLAD